MRKLTTLIAASMTAALALSAGMAVMADEPDFTGEGSIAYVVTGLGDMSFNDSGEVGMNTLRAAGYDVKTVETGDDASGYEDTMYDLLDTGYDYVIASSTYKDQIEKVAPEFTDTKFVLFDVNSDTEVASDNILYIYFKQNESSYLGGIVAVGVCPRPVPSAPSAEWRTRSSRTSSPDMWMAHCPTILTSRSAPDGSATGVIPQR